MQSASEPRTRTVLGALLASAVAGALLATPAAAQPHRPGSPLTPSAAPAAPAPATGTGTGTEAGTRAATATGAGTRPGAAARAAIQRALDDIARSGTPGVLATLDDRGSRWTGEAGVADLRTGRERQARDHFRIGSITKSYVATVILQLEAEGVLDLDDTVERWLPGVVTGNGHDGSAITVRQLLNHTSGVKSYTDDPTHLHNFFGAGFLKHRYDDYRPADLVRIAMRYAPDFAPGTSWYYSNTNYVLAGMIIEKATGNSFEHEVDHRLLRPLGLRNTVTPRSTVTMPRPAGRGYAMFEPGGPVHDVTELNATFTWAAGDMISTTGDTGRFLRALITGRLLPPAQQKELTTAVAADPAVVEDGAYALGIYPRTLSCGVKVWGHTGGTTGSGSEAFITADGKRSLVTNVNGNWGGPAPDPVEAAFCTP
ncbi:serine hydrolase domain-containing protein [Streptomyces sp. CAU 1734]|uniref:serine hydrolase domain-containing protein n=1 Tax=Streptomyces sp. CAU 1734 TaxID=3140360 RepID=UPI003260CB48